MICTVYKDIYDKDSSRHIDIDGMLDRIKNGKSKEKIEAIRSAIDKDKADLLKKGLPCVLFSGKFSRRFDENLLEHSGYMVLDFDEVYDIGTKSAEILDKIHDIVYAMWLSPRGNGLKVLVKIADGTKHREHFAALLELFPLLDEYGKPKYKDGNLSRPLYELDRSGVNPSRVCYESYDPNMYRNADAKPFTGLKIEEKVVVKDTVKEDNEVFKRLLSWLSNRNDAFVTGERNLFIFKLASSCCRFGIELETSERLITAQFPPSNDFTRSECTNAIKSAYRANKGQFGTCSFDKDLLVDKVTRKEVEIDLTIYDTDVKPRDVVYGQDVKEHALNIYDTGYGFVSGIGVVELDNLFKMRRGEITLLTGIGNYGKSAFKKWYQVFRAVKFGEKFASFPPEDYPIQNFYHELTEILLCCDCTPSNPNRPSREAYDKAYDFISAHFFYIHPTDLSPTPEYIKQRFLELIIKEKVDGCDIDPFNQMTNDYSKAGGRDDKYLEAVLADFLRFAQQNDVYFWIVAHPRAMTKQADGNYPCPDVFDLAGGAMWNNKMNNILVYHRPLKQMQPNDALCHFHAKKIKDQKVTGSTGMVEMEYSRKKRRFVFDTIDYLEAAILEAGLKLK